MPPKFLGCIDSIHDGKINGWAISSTDKTRPLRVVLFINGKRVLSATTDVHRPDVSWVHECHEACGFSLQIPEQAIHGQHFTYEVKIEEDPTFSLPANDAIPQQAANTLRLPEALYNAVKLQDAILNALRDNTRALVALNNDPNVRLRQLDPNIATVYIINGCERTASEQFRVYALAQCIQRLGLSSLIFSIEDIPFLPADHVRACIFVRVAATTAVSTFVTNLRAAGARVVADFDDLVFRPSLLEAIDGVRFLTETAKERYGSGMLQYRELLRIADEVWVTTTALKREAEAINQRVHVLRNFPLPDARKGAAAALASKNFGSPHFTIGYYSGTLTHQADFRVCYAPLADFLERNQDAYLKIVGEFNLDEFPDLAKHNRVIHKGMLPYAEMMQDIAKCDLVLAPLVVGDNFCESKSELKFFDAALCHTPIIASATDNFRTVIEHGVNGFIAKTPQDWFDILTLCYQRRRTLKDVSLAAHRTVADLYSLDAQIAAYREAFVRLGLLDVTAHGATVANVRFTKAPGESQRLAILLPDIMIGSGGHRKALTFAAEYVARGGEVEVIFLSNRSDAELTEIVQRHYFPSCGRIRAYSGRPPIADVIVATSWPTAYIVDGWPPNARKFYFVQDFEPLFSPMNSDYALAYNSYRLKLEVLPFGRWNAAMLSREFDIECKAIDFPVDREIYFPDLATQRESRRLLFYARPSQPRRLYELGHQAILQLRSIMPDWDFVYYGEEIADFNFHGIRCIGQITNLADLRRLYSSASIGLAFSSTNPSLVPFEMLACGLPVVDVRVSKLNPDFLDCPSVVYSDPTPTGLAKTIYKLASSRDELNRLSSAAEIWAQNLPRETDFSNAVLERLGLLNNQPASGSPV